MDGKRTATTTPSPHERSCRFPRTPRGATCRRAGGWRMTPSTSATARTSSATIPGTCPARWPATRFPVKSSRNSASPPIPRKMKAYVRALLAIALVGMLATPALIRRFSNRAAASSVVTDDARARYGFRLTEVSKASGVSFVHEAPTLDGKLAHIMPQVASMGAAVAVADVDADGRPDLYVTNSKEGSRNHLYRNRGDGTFEDVAERFGVADVSQREAGVSMGAVFGDYDNDGFEDLFPYKWGKLELFHNDQGRQFSRVTGTALPSWANINTAVWLDYDRDGLLDLFLGGYYPDRVNLWQLGAPKVMPESFEYAKNGGRKYLYRNL